MYLNLKVCEVVFINNCNVFNCMNRKLKKVLQIGLPVVVVACVVLPRIDFFPEKLDMVSAPGGKKGGVLPVTGMIAAYETVSNGIPVTGTMLPNERVDLVSETAGKVVQICFQEGQRVKKGDLLLKVDDSDLLAQLKREEFQKKLLEDRLKRQQVLLDRESVSYESFQELETEYRMLLEDIELLKVKINRTEIRAPFNGRMGFRYVSEGTYLQQNTQVSTIVDDAVLKVEFTIPEKYALLSLENRVLSFNVAGHDKKVTAKVYAIDVAADDVHKVAVRARYNNTDGLMPGAFVSGELLTEEGLRYMLVPSEAVVPEMDGKRLWVKKNGVATSVPIETVSRDERMVEVVSGIQPGDTVLTGGLMQLREGMKVDVKI